MFAADEIEQLQESAVISDGHVESSGQQRILIVASGRLLREGLQQMLAGPNRVFLGDCGDIDQLEDTLDAAAPPDLIFLSTDNVVQVTGVLSQIRAVRARVPATRWIMLIRKADLPHLGEAVEIGINGLLLEDTSATVLRLVTDLVLEGHSCMPDGLVRLLGTGGVSHATEAPRVVASKAAAPVSPWKTPGLGFALSERESEILQALVAGQTNKTVARELGIAEATVKAHVKALMRKLQVTNRTQAAIMGMGMFRTPEPDAPQTRSPDLAAMGLGLPADCEAAALCN